MKDCPKCSSEKVDVKHVEEGKVINASSCEKIESEFIRSSEYSCFFQLKAKIQHLLCACKNCGYLWRENTADHNT